MKPYFDNGVVQLYQADAREMPLSDRSVHCVVTSPPYYGLRVYQGNDGQGIGLEVSVEAYIANLVAVFREVKRCLRSDGVCFVNIGDSYGSGGGNHQERDGVDVVGWTSREQAHPSFGAAGNRLGIPERVVLALQADGWVWRDTVIWAKKSAMPESVNGWRWEQCRVKVGQDGRGREGHKTAMGMNRAQQDHDGKDFAQDAQWTDCPGCPKCADTDGRVLRKGSWRTTSAHEYIFMLTKGMGYYADGEAVKTAAAAVSIDRMHYGLNTNGRPGKQDVHVDKMGDRWLSNGGANRRSVWSDISPEPYGGQHFATFPSDLPRICIQASTSEAGCCSVCGSQWARVVERNPEYAQWAETQRFYGNGGEGSAFRLAKTNSATVPQKEVTLAWHPTCACPHANPVPAVVLDPFAGTATTCLAAQRLGRRAVGLDLSEAYLRQAVKRLEGVSLPLISNPC